MNSPLIVPEKKNQNTGILLHRLLIWYGSQYISARLPVVLDKLCFHFWNVLRHLSMKSSVVLLLLLLWPSCMSLLGRLALAKQRKGKAPLAHVLQWSDSFNSSALVAEDLKAASCKADDPLGCFKGLVRHIVMSSFRFYQYPRLASSKIRNTIVIPTVQLTYHTHGIIRIGNEVGKLILLL